MGLVADSGMMMEQESIHWLYHFSSTALVHFFNFTIIPKDLYAFVPTFYTYRTNVANQQKG